MIRVAVLKLSYDYSAPLFCPIFSNVHILYNFIFIGNSMFSSTIWEKHARVSFSKTIKIARVRSWNAIEVFEKLTRSIECVFFRIARRTILLLINNIHEKIMQSCA